MTTARIDPKDLGSAGRSVHPPDPEVPDRPQRRKFTADYKRRILRGILEQINRRKVLLVHELGAAVVYRLANRLELRGLARATQSTSPTRRGKTPSMEDRGLSDALFPIIYEVSCTDLYYCEYVWICLPIAPPVLS